GKSVYSKDIYGQIRKTLDIFNELISSEGATFQDISQATVFLKNSDDFDIYKKIIEEYKLENMPAVCIQANICREDLLFEIDGTICKSK
ncbi:MAG TPA: Rid family hydrolase, partial [Candidatus Lokiarchaeia archaeon]